MKQIKINKVLAGLGAVLLMGSFSSCLKNGKYYTDFSSITASVDLPLAASNNNSPVPFSYDATASSPSIPVIVNLASATPLSTATTATLAVDQSYLDSYNTDNGTSYLLMPSDAYTVTGWDVTIPAGKRIDSMVVTFDFSKLDLTQQYILPITISQASQPIEQWNHLMLNIQVKNQFDGDYHCTGYVFHPSAPRANDATYSIKTAGPYTNIIPMGDLGSAGYQFKATVNGTSGVVPLTNYAPAAAAPVGSSFMTDDEPGATDFSAAAPNVPGQAPWVKTTYNNTYDYDAKKFWVHVGYNAGLSAPDQTQYTRQFYLKFVKK
ncbi:MAG TPA: DUF1735 domain-containing protein [Chitinophagaceae bacterium]|nr:DUF1735 domain-containing protein [Chitinophagaceae bacterium]